MRPQAVSVWPAMGDGEAWLGGLGSLEGRALDAAGVAVSVAGAVGPVAGWHATRPSDRMAANVTPRIDTDIASIVALSARMSRDPPQTCAGPRRPQLRRGPAAG